MGWGAEHPGGRSGAAGPRALGHHRPTPLHFVAPARVLSAFVQHNCKLPKQLQVAIASSRWDPAHATWQMRHAQRDDNPALVGLMSTEPDDNNATATRLPHVHLEPSGVYVVRVFEAFMTRSIIFMTPAIKNSRKGWAVRGA